MNELKEAAGRAAAGLAADGMVVGLGTGSTVAFVLRELGRRVRDEGLKIVGVPTSRATEKTAGELGIAIRNAEEVAILDLALDGADELDPAGQCIKGGGGAHVREKIVAAMAREFVVVVDESKCVQRLGMKFPVPVEALWQARSLVSARLEALGARVELRERKDKAGPSITDNGNPIIDAHFGPIDDPAALDAAINAIPGVVGHGLFVGMAKRALIGRQVGEDTRVETVAYR